ncbi:MAG: HAD hydrolase family protein [Bacillota bacterium]|nr:HAD hydrolase family protein [Bacillota bacterium]
MQKYQIEHRNIQDKHHLPKIGMRIFKTTVAVFICLIISLFRGDNAIPFYSAIATVLCMQPYVGNSVKVALNRVYGTIIGAIYGCLVLLAEIYLLPQEPIEAHYLLVAVAIVPVIYTTLVFKQKAASYIACVAFLSVTITTTVDISPFLFAFERVMDTIIGIVVALVINIAAIPRRKNRDILFISALDETLVTPNNTLTDYGKVLLNQMIQDGMNFTVSTARTPASLMEPMAAVDLKLPVIAANGALLFDLKEKRYVKKWEMPYETTKAVTDFLNKRQVNAFITSVIDDVLLIYYGDFNNAAEELLYEELRSSPYRNYVKAKLPPGRKAIYIMVLISDAEVKYLAKALKNQDFASKIYVYTQPAEYEGFSYLKVYDKGVSRRKMMEYLQKELKLKKIVTFGSIEGVYDIVVHDNDTNTVVKNLKQLYEPYIWKKCK